MRHQLDKSLVKLGLATAAVSTAIRFLGVPMILVAALVLGLLIAFCGLKSKSVTKAQVSAILLLSCAWPGPFGLAMYLNSPAVPIDFIVPVGYQATIEIVRDRENGQDLRFENGRCLFMIPASGTIRVREAYPFHQSHIESCRDVAGAPRRLERQQETAGTRFSSYGSESSTELDGTIYRWKVH